MAPPAAHLRPTCDRPCCRAMLCINMGIPHTCVRDLLAVQVPVAREQSLGAEQALGVCGHCSPIQFVPQLRSRCEMQIFHAAPCSHILAWGALACRPIRLHPFFSGWAAQTGPGGGAVLCYADVSTCVMPACEGEEPGHMHTAASTMTCISRTHACCTHACTSRLQCSAVLCLHGAQCFQHGCAVWGGGRSPRLWERRPPAACS